MDSFLFYAVRSSLVDMLDKRMLIALRDGRNFFGVLRWWSHPYSIHVVVVSTFLCFLPRLQIFSGVVWCGVGVVWCGSVVWCGVVVWCAVVWCAVLCCAVVWCCGVLWCGVFFFRFAFVCVILFVAF